MYGYQALGALLREGTYDQRFLTSVGRDLIAMDKKDPEIWSRNLPYNQDMAFNLGAEGGRGFNPLTGLMDAMSRHPAAAAEFFNESLRSDTNNDGIVTMLDLETSGKDAQSVVDYMLDKKPRTTGTTRRPTAAPRSARRPWAMPWRRRSRPRAGRRRRTAGTPLKDMSGVMEKVVEKIGTNPELISAKAGDPPGPLSALAPQFGDMAAEYMPDLQATAENAAARSSRSASRPSSRST